MNPPTNRAESKLPNEDGREIGAGCPAAGLFSEDLRSDPPRIVLLRVRYEDLKEAYDAASEHEDESGEAIPRDLWLEYHAVIRELRREEHRLLQSSENAEVCQP